MVITKKSPTSPPRGGSGGNPIHHRRSPSTLLIPSSPPAHATGQSSLAADGGGTWPSCTCGGEERPSRWLTCSGSAWRGGGWSRAALRRVVAMWLLLCGSPVQRGVAAVQGTTRDEDSTRWRVVRRSNLSRYLVNENTRKQMMKIKTNKYYGSNEMQETKVTELAQDR